MKRAAKTAKDFKRRRPRRVEQPTILIICEGSKTEPNYLRELVDDLRLTAITIIDGEGGASPTSVFEQGKSLYYESMGFEQIYFVCDRDDHADYQRALQKMTGFAKRRDVKATVQIISSVPCFELWYLLHFTIPSASFNKTGNRTACENLIARLKREPLFAQYTKETRGYYTALKEKLPEAISHSKRRLKQSLAVGDPLHHGNPTSQMHLLVEDLQKIARESGRLPS